MTGEVTRVHARIVRLMGGWLNSRERIIERSTPLLEPGEIVAHVIRGLEGPNRWVAIVASFVVAFPLAGILHVPVLAFVLFLALFTTLYARRIVLATDRGIVVIRAGRWRYTPRQVLDRL